MLHMGVLQECRWASDLRAAGEEARVSCAGLVGDGASRENQRRRGAVAARAVTSGDTFPRHAPPQGAQVSVRSVP